MQDNSGISLSTSDPDNNNQPEQLGDGGAADAEDYCSAELFHGDTITCLLQSAGSSPAATTGSGKQILGRRKGKGGKPYLVLLGVVAAVFVGLVILNGG